MNHFVPRKWVYVAGPMSIGDTVLHVRKAILTANKIILAGLHPHVPHLTQLWHMITPKTWEEWLDMDEQTLSRCDALYRLPGESIGADREIRFAEARGIPVFYLLRELYETLLDDLPKNWKELI